MVTARVLEFERIPVMDSDEPWDRLARAVGSSPFSRPGWVRSWSEMTGRKLVLAHVGNAAAVWAVLPMVRRGGGLASAADWHVPALEAVAADDRAYTILAGEVIKGRSRVTLDFCDSAGSTAEAFRREFADRGYAVMERVRMHSPYIDLTLGRERFESDLGAKRTRELERRRRRLEEEGRVAVTVSDGSAGLDRDLFEGIAVEGSGWKHGAGTAIRSERATEVFYRRVARWAAEEGMLRLAFLRIDGLPIAFDLSLVSAGREWLLKTGFSPDWARFSPGSLLRGAAIDRAFAEGLDSYEFGGEADPWKLEWTRTTRDIVTIDGFAPGLSGSMLRAASRVAANFGALTHRDTP